MQMIICRAWRCFTCRFLVVMICHNHYLAALGPLGLGALVSQCHFRLVRSCFKSRKYPLETSRYFGYNNDDRFEAPLGLAISFYFRVRP